jgi:hypothetical protein
LRELPGHLETAALYYGTTTRPVSYGTRDINSGK